LDIKTTSLCGPAGCFFFPLTKAVYMHIWFEPFLFYCCIKKIEAPPVWRPSYADQSALDLGQPCDISYTDSHHTFSHQPLRYHTFSSKPPKHL
jgi:hypothetical protein